VAKMEAKIAFVVPVLICALIFVGMGILSIDKDTPMHFWSGTTVKAEEISNVKSYNKENGIMWIIYGSTYILSAILTIFFGSKIGVLIVTLSCTVGLIALILVYTSIYKKYKVRK
jgi:hypothetical protein